MEKTCCFIGHREINETDDLCYDIVTEIKKKHPHIKRIFVRAEYPYIDESYKKYLLKSYEDTYFPKAVEGAGKASYVKRNCEMIDSSRFCVVYYKADYAPKGRKSGTKIALTYAEKKKKNIIKFP